MKISDVEVIRFKTPTLYRRSRWAFLLWDKEPTESIESIIKITTDDGAEGYMMGASGGSKEALETRVKPLLVGEDPRDRQKLWIWMNQMCLQSPELGLDMMTMGVVDAALWDLFGRMVGQPVLKILGGCRDKVLAYASTYPELGGPEEYAENALKCKERSYKAYKVCAYTALRSQQMGASPAAPWLSERGSRDLRSGP